MVGTREHLTSAGPAEEAMLSWRGLKGNEIFLPDDFESFGFGDQNGGEGRARHLPAIGAMAIGKHEQLAVYFIFDGLAVTTTFEHDFIPLSQRFIPFVQCVLLSDK